MTHAIYRKQRMRGLGHRRPVFRMDLPAAGKPTEAVIGDVLTAKGRDHSRRLGRRGGVDAGDASMGMRAADDKGVELMRAVDVVGVGALSGQKTEILAPPDRGSDRGHRPTPPPPRERWPGEPRRA